MEEAFFEAPEEISSGVLERPPTDTENPDNDELLVDPNQELLSSALNIVEQLSKDGRIGELAQIANAATGKIEQAIADAEKMHREVRTQDLGSQKGAESSTANSRAQEMIDRIQKAISDKMRQKP